MENDFFICNIIIIPFITDWRINTIANIIISKYYSLHLKEKIKDCFFADFEPDFRTISFCLHGYFSVFMLKNA